LEVDPKFVARFGSYDPVVIWLRATLERAGLRVRALQSHQAVEFQKQAGSD